MGRQNRRLPYTLMYTVIFPVIKISTSIYIGFLGLPPQSSTGMSGLKQQKFVLETTHLRSEWQPSCFSRSFSSYIFSWTSLGVSALVWKGTRVLLAYGILTYFNYVLEAWSWKILAFWGNLGLQQGNWPVGTTQFSPQQYPFCAFNHYTRI